MEQARKVLIVDDDQELTTLLAEIFTSEGWNASTCNDSLHAVGLVVSQRPSLVLLDIQMERPDTGWTLLSLLRETLDSTRDIPIIVISGTTVSANRHHAWLQQQGIPLVKKPFDPFELVEKAEQVTHLSDAGSTVAYE